MCEYTIGWESGLALLYVTFKLLQLSHSNMDGNLIFVQISEITREKPFENKSWEFEKTVDYQFCFQ